MKKVDISIELSEPLRKIVYLALFPELGRSVPRTDVSVTETTSGITMSINAEDSSALRGALNSYLRWIDCIIATNLTFGEGA